MEQKLFLGALAWYLNEHNFFSFRQICRRTWALHLPYKGTLSQLRYLVPHLGLQSSISLGMCLYLVNTVGRGFKNPVLLGSLASSVWRIKQLVMWYISEPNWDRETSHCFRLYLDFRTFLGVELRFQVAFSLFWDFWLPTQLHLLWDVVHCPSRALLFSTTSMPLTCFAVSFSLLQIHVHFIFTTDVKLININN